MKIGGLQKTSLIDYPKKIAAVIFTQGCDFRCPYCHNPELVLPQNFRATISSEEVIGFLQKRMGKLNGVVVTGGEPTQQRGLLNFLRDIKDMGYAVKLDTNGSRPDVIQRCLQKKLIDYIAMDIKAPLDKYELVCGARISMEKIQESIQLILSSSVEYEFRSTLVRSLLNETDIASIAQWVKKARRLVFKKAMSDNKNLDACFKKREGDGFSDEEIASFQRKYGKKI